MGMVHLLPLCPFPPYPQIPAEHRYMLSGTYTIALKLMAKEVLGTIAKAKAYRDDIAASVIKDGLGTFVVKPEGGTQCTTCDMTAYPGETIRHHVLCRHYIGVK